MVMCFSSKYYRNEKIIDIFFLKIYHLEKGLFSSISILALVYWRRKIFCLSSL